MYSRSVFLVAMLVLPIFAAPVPATHEIQKRDVNIEHRDTPSLLDSFRSIIGRDPIIEAIPSETPVAVEHKREEEDATVALDERGISRHKGNDKRGITRTKGNSGRGITPGGGNGKRGITRTKGNSGRGITPGRGNGKRGITGHKGNGKRSLVARTLEYLLG